MIVWRITSEVMVQSALSGEGAFRYPGRWNHFGTPMVYTAGTSSLAALEYLAHVPRHIVRPVHLVLLQIELPEEVATLGHDELPADWSAIPPSNTTRDLGTEWARKRATLALKVPTVVLPPGVECNVLVNPLHPRIAEVKVVAQRLFDLDARMLKDEP